MTDMTNKIKQLADFFREKKGYFFLARLCIKIGKDISGIKEDAPEDPELLKRVTDAAKELGVPDRELEEIISAKLLK